MASEGSIGVVPITQVQAAGPLVALSAADSPLRNGLGVVMT
jgi:hypothetical protein